MNEIEELSDQIAFVCQDHPSDVIMNALLTGVVSMILGCCPKDQQSEVAEKFALAILSNVADQPDERGTIQ